MYRLVFALLVCAGAASSAPPDSKVTFVQIQPVVDEPALGSADELVRRARQDDVTSDQDESVTEEIVTERERGTSPRSTTARSFGRTARPAPRPAAPPAAPRAVSKLSYFNDAGSASSNLLQPPADSGRKFRTTCRCEKIWNCPKLQITVPRCPNEYFLCCS